MIVQIILPQLPKKRDSRLYAAVSSETLQVWLRKVSRQFEADPVIYKTKAYTADTKLHDEMDELPGLEIALTSILLVADAVHVGQKTL